MMKRKTMRKRWLRKLMVVYLVRQSAFRRLWNWSVQLQKAFLELLEALEAVVGK